MTSESKMGAAACRLAAMHDTVTQAGYRLAGLCLVVIVVSFCYEVVSRYFFAAPTPWATPMVAYMLCTMVFLAMPELTRRRSHIFISIVLDQMKPEQATQVQRVTRLVAAVTCLLAAYFCLDATLMQYKNGIATVNEWRIPKWMLSMVIPYGLFSTSIYFFRQVADKDTYSSEGVG